MDWTEYRVNGPARHAPPWAGRRRHRLLRLLVVFAIIWVVVRLVRGRRSTWF